MGLLLVIKFYNKTMATYLKIKPYSVLNDQGYGFANAIYWVVSELYRGDENAKLFCNLVNVSIRQIPDENGVLQDIEFISPSLMDFQMDITKEMLDAWGPDSIIDDFVLSYDSNFEKE